MPLKEGQQVLIKNPRPLVATVVRERPGDRNMPEEQRRYIVRISEDALQEQYIYPPSNLEPIREPEIVRYSPEWTAEFQRWLDAAVKWSANHSDRDAWNQFSESGSKLGFYIPISQDSQTQK